MEITKEANTQEIDEYLDTNDSWNNLTLYYDIGYIMFMGEFDDMVLLYKIVYHNSNTWRTYIDISPLLLF